MDGVDYILTNWMLRFDNGISWTERFLQVDIYLKYLDIEYVWYASNI